MTMLNAFRSCAGTTAPRLAGAARMPVDVYPIVGIVSAACGMGVFSIGYTATNFGKNIKPKGNGTGIQ